MKLNKIILPICLALFTLSCKVQHQLDKQAHRGGRGLMPENTIGAMKNAMDLNTTLELDLYLSNDKKIIVSHDDRMSSLFVLTPDGKPISKEEEKKYLLHKMNYEEIRRFDVGSKPHPGFPQQKKVAAYIPLLSELIDSVEAYAELRNYKKPLYDIEAKMTASTGAVPGYREDFIKEMAGIIKEKKIGKRVTVQSFDPGMLEIVHRDYPKLKTAFLVAKGDLESNLKKLTFKPDAYSPIYTLIDAQLVQQCHKRGIKVIAWTPNTSKEIAELKALGVDAIITDYPNLF